MKFILKLTIALSTQLSMAYADSQFSCNIWKPNQDIQTVVITGADLERFPLVDKSHHLNLSVLQDAEMSIALFQSNSKELITLARGTEDVTLSHKLPRVVVHCEKN